MCKWCAPNANSRPIIVHYMPVRGGDGRRHYYLACSHSDSVSKWPVFTRTAQGKQP